MTAFILSKEEALTAYSALCGEYWNDEEYRNDHDEKSCDLAIRLIEHFGMTKEFKMLQSEKQLWLDRKEAAIRTAAEQAKLATMTNLERREYFGKGIP